MRSEGLCTKNASKIFSPVEFTLPPRNFLTDPRRGGGALLLILSDSSASLCAKCDTCVCTSANPKPSDEKLNVHTCRCPPADPQSFVRAMRLRGGVGLRHVPRLATSWPGVVPRGYRGVSRIRRRPELEA